MIIIRTRHFPFGSYTTINLFGILFTKRKNLSKRTINHERIHTKQMKEMLFIFFYLWYGLEYIIIRLFHVKQNDAYHDVSLEEAHNNDDNQDYIYLREHYAWLKYIRIRSAE